MTPVKRPIVKQNQLIRSFPRGVIVQSVFTHSCATIALNTTMDMQDAPLHLPLQYRIVGVRIRPIGRLALIQRNIFPRVLSGYAPDPALAPSLRRSIRHFSIRAPSGLVPKFPLVTGSERPDFGPRACLIRTVHSGSASGVGRFAWLDAAATHRRPGGTALRGRTSATRQHAGERFAAACTARRLPVLTHQHVLAPQASHTFPRERVFQVAGFCPRPFPPSRAVPLRTAASSAALGGGRVVPA